MSARAPSYVVGIDLGTTHTVVAFAPVGGESPTQVLEIPQPIDDVRFEPRVLLPSCLYAPLDGELSDARALAPGTPFASGHLREELAAVAARGPRSAHPPVG